LRKAGVTIRKSNDCLIAAYAILGDLYLLHKDRDFEEISKQFNLKLV
jgi:predicted nucleic acid-binding protein